MKRHRKAWSQEFYLLWQSIFSPRRGSLHTWAVLELRLRGIKRKKRIRKGVITPENLNIATPIKYGSDLCYKRCGLPYLELKANCVYVGFFVPFCPHPWHAELPGPGVEPVPQNWPKPQQQHVGASSHQVTRELLVQVKGIHKQPILMMMVAHSSSCSSNSSSGK